MRKSLSIIMAVLGLAFSADLSAKKVKEIIETPASDSRIEYTGRTLVNGNDVSYDWSGVYFRVKFNGPYLAMKCSDTNQTFLFHIQLYHSIPVRLITVYKMINISL